jgi:hypothetical protein
VHEGYCFMTQQAARDMINLDCSITHPERKLRYIREKQNRLIVNVEFAAQPKVHTPERQDMLFARGVSHCKRIRMVETSSSSNLLHSKASNS